MQPTNEKKLCCCHAFDNHFEFQHNNRPIVVLTDKGSSTSYKYHNKTSDHLAKYQIDGGLITDGVRCDYLLLNCEKKHSIFIEIKGSDLLHAVDQLDRSIDLLKTKLLGFAVFARIVVSRMNTINLKSSRLLKLEKKLELLNGNLKYKCKILEDTN